MLLFFSIIAILLLLILIVYLSEIQLKVENLELSFCTGKFQANYSVKVGLYFLGKIQLWGKRLTNSENKKTKKNTLLKRKLQILRDGYKRKYNNTERENVIKQFLQLKKRIEIKLFKLNVDIDTESAPLTSYLVGGISAFIPNLIRPNIRNIKRDSYYFSILPVYKNQNYIYLKMNSVIGIKIVHITNVLRVVTRSEKINQISYKIMCNCEWSIISN